MAYNLTANVKYKENCEYNASEDTCIFTIEEQQTTCSMTFSPQVITIGQTTNITVEVKSNNKDVKIGTVTVYRYIDENTKVPIVNDVCKIKDGKVIIKYQPTTTGNIKLIAEYTNISNRNSQLFKTSTNEQILTVNKIGTQTTFIPNDTDIITNPKEKAVLKAKVCKGMTDEPVPFGRVTFLYYENPEADLTDNIEAHVIGNPVFVDENGIATLNYIPEQTFENLDHAYYEDIFAIYNYKNDHYGKQWHYYGESKDSTRVYIAQEKALKIELKDDSQAIPQPLSIDNDEYKWGCAEEGQQIGLYVNLFEDNKSINFQPDDKVYIYIQGTCMTPKNTSSVNFTSDEMYVRENFNFIDFGPIVKEVNYNPSKQCFYSDTLTSDGTSLSPGYYLIYGVFGEHKGTVNLNTNKTIEEYVKSTEHSMIYYLQVNYETATNISISINENYYPDLNSKLEIIGTVNNLTDNQINNLSGAKCRYYIPRLSDNPFEGILYKDANDNQIKTKLTDNVYINTPGVYTAYIMIPKGIYNNKIQLPAIYSNQMAIKVTTDISPTLEILQVYDYPGAVKYKLTVPGIVEDTIEAHISNDNDTITQYFDETAQSFTGTFTNVTLGEHTLTAEVLIKGEPQTLTQTYEVRKSLINYEIKEESKNVLASPTQAVSMLVSCSGNNITDLNTDNIHITVDNKDADVTDIRFINEYQNCIITFNSSAVTKGNHTVQLFYEDDNFVSSEAEVTFNTNTVVPKYNIELKDNTYYISIINYYNAEIVPILVNFDNTKKCTVITNTQGIATVEYDEEYDEDIWCNFENVKLYINPTPENGDYYELNITSALQAQIDMYEEYGIYFAYYEESTKEYYIGR